MSVDTQGRQNSNPGSPGLGDTIRSALAQRSRAAFYAPFASYTARPRAVGRYRVFVSHSVLLTLWGVPPVGVKVVTTRTFSDCVFLAARAFAVRRQVMVTLPAVATVFRAVHTTIVPAFLAISVARGVDRRVVPT